MSDNKTLTLTEAIVSNKQKPKIQINKAMEKIIGILSQPLLPVEQEKVYSVLNDFVNLYFINELSKKYPLISNEIFDLTNETTFTLRYKKYDVEVPVIVKLALEKSNADIFKLDVKGKEASGYDKGREVNIEINCHIPEIIPEARAAIAESIGFSAEITSNAYKDELISKILMLDRMNKKNIKDPLDANYNLVWAPSAWDAKIVEKDPAIFMNYSGKNFLIHQWEIPEERSLDAMLREFRETLE